MGTCCGALHPRAWCSAKGSKLGQVGPVWAQVGSERRTYELLSLRPTIKGGQVGPKWRQVVPKCRQNVPPNCHNVPTRFPQGSQEGCFSLPQGASESIFGCVQGKGRSTASIGFALGYNLLGLQRVSISYMNRGPGGIH